MGEEGLANAASESEAVVAPAENGTAPHDDSNVLTERKTEESNGVKEKEDDKDEEKLETEKMDIGRDLKEDHDKKEQKEEEEAKTEEMEEEAPADKKEKVPEEMKEDEENNEEADKGVIDGVKNGEGLDEEIKEEKLGEEKDEEAEEEKNDEKKVEESEEKEQEKTKSKEEQTETEKAEQSTEEKGPKKRRRQKNAWGKVEGNRKQKEKELARTPRTPTVDRPVRERKSVERLVASIERDATKDFQIEKGRGTPLKDIPNVAFKLSRRKTDDTFKLLHNILFGRRGKAFQIKGNISRFSGFVWHDNEEKQRNKVKEKFDKCTKEKLLELCDVLDIQVSKTSTRKEDIVTKLIDFLVAPHATTAVLLAEKESGKGQKRKRVVKGTSSASKSSSKRTFKSRRKSEDNSKKERKKPASDTEDDMEEEKEEEQEDEQEQEQEEEEEPENGVSEKSDDEMPDQSESEEKDVSEDESEEDTGKKKRSRAKSSSKKESVGKAKSRKSLVSNKSSPPPKATTKKSSSKRTKVDDDSDSSPTVFSRKKNEKVTKKSSTPAKSASKEKTGKKAAKGKGKSKEGTIKPSDVELRNAICEILKEVDFNTATFTDILRQLAEQFDTDLTPRKSSIKLMIQEELTKLADEADDEDGEGDAEKDEPVADAPEVKA